MSSRLSSPVYRTRERVPLEDYDEERQRRSIVRSTSITHLPQKVLTQEVAMIPLNDEPHDDKLPVVVAVAVVFAAVHVVVVA